MGASRPIYFSRQNTSKLPKTIGITALVGGVVALVLGIIYREFAAFYAAFICFFAGSFVAFMTVTVKVDDEKVVIKFCDVFKRTLLRDQIESVTEDKTSLGSGFGYRILGPRLRGYVVGGPEVYIEMQNGSGVIVSVPDPEKLVSILVDN